MTKRIRTITVSVIVLVLIGAGFLFLRSDTGDSLLQVESVGEADGVGGTVISLLARLRTVELKKDILSSPGFQSLVDYGVELDDQPIGRTNPFAPVGTDAFLDVQEDSDVEDEISTTTPPTEIEEGDGSL